MAFETNHNEPLLAGETKRITLFPKDENGDAGTPALLTLEVRAQTDTTNYALNPGTGEEQIEGEAQSGYYVDHTFAQGASTLVAAMTDGAGSVEKAKGEVTAKAA